MTACSASASKRLELSWVWGIWAEIFIDGHRAAICESAWAGGTWVPLIASFATWKVSSSLQGIYRGLAAGDKSMTGGTTPAPLPSLLSQRVWTALRLVNQPSSPFCGLLLSPGPCLQPQMLLAFCFLYASCPSLSVCRALRWTSADALLGSSCCHQRGWYPATGAPCVLHHPPQDFTSDPTKRCCSQESWLGLTLRKRQKFPVLPLLFCSCVSSFSLFLFLLKRTLVLLI